MSLNNGLFQLGIDLQRGSSNTQAEVQAEVPLRAGRTGTRPAEARVHPARVLATRQATPVICVSLGLTATPGAV